MRKNKSGSMSLSDIPSFVETVELGKVLQKRVVAKRNSWYARCMPIQAKGVIINIRIRDGNEGEIITYFENHHRKA